MDALIWVVICLLILAAIRNHVTYKIRMAALNTVSAKAKAAIEEGDCEFARFYKQFEERSYDQIMFDLTVWTARQAYPRLYD